MVEQKAKIEDLALESGEIDWDILAGMAGFHPNINSTIGAFKIDDNPNPTSLKERVLEYLKDNPKILKNAKRFKKDLVAYGTSHGKQLLIGVEIAAAVGLGGMVIYRYRQRKIK